MAGLQKYPWDRMTKAVSGPPEWYVEQLERLRTHPQLETTDYPNGRQIYHVSMGRMMGVSPG
jgi:hypothetical protein